MFRKVLQIISNLAPKRWLQSCALVFVIFVITTTTSTAHAQVGVNLTALITDSIANFFYTLQTIASWLIYLAGALLNFSIYITLHIKEFVTATPAIYTVWKAIRDIAGMFLIFSLLYAAIMLITSYEKPNFGGLIKNIVVAGVLINFSFFLTGLAIDVSNVVSLQLYRAIAPVHDTNVSAQNGFINQVLELGKLDGGLSTIFMQSLGVTRLYNPDGSMSSTGKKFQQDGSVWTASLKIILIGTTSIIIMITAALSFFLASLAFIVRFVILLFLLAFSPIWFASFIVPEIGKYADMWKKQLKSQLIFMPVYLFLMYFALSVLTSSSIFNGGYAGPLTSNGDFLSDLMVLAVNAVLVIVMMNAPLLGAMSMGAIMPKWADKVGADAIWKKVGGIVGGAAGRGTIGAGANWLNKNIDKSTTEVGFGKYKYSLAKLGNTVVGKDLRDATLGAATKAKFGDDRSYEDLGKVKKDLGKKQKEIDRRKKFEVLLSEARANIPPQIDPNTNKPINVGTALSSMGEKEVLGLGTKQLKDPEVVKHLKKSHFEAISKSDDFSPSDIQEIKNARRETFRSVIDNNESDAVKHMMNNMDVDDVVAMAGDKMQEDAVIAHLTPDMLKAIGSKALLDDADKRRIGNKIDVWSSNTATNPTGATHKAYSFVNKNNNEWL